jgi:hypothetical protein
MLDEFLRVDHQRLRSEMGSVTMLMLEKPATRRESTTVAKLPKGTVSSQRRKIAS